MKQVSARVISNSQILPGFTRPHARTILNSNIIWLSCAEIAQKAKPGQFVMVRCGADYTLPRPFSIHQVNGAGIALFFAVWEGGKGTKWLSQRHKGHAVEVFGPLGNGFSVYPASEKLLMVAGGHGIAPLYFLAQKAKDQERSVTLLYGTANDKRYPISHDIKVVAATEDGTVGYQGMITDLLPNYVDWADQVFACGPMPMYRDMANKYNPFLKDKPVQVSLEVRMGCGLGVCYGCTVNTKRGLRQVCKDGPIFNLEDIHWDELAYNY